MYVLLMSKSCVPQKHFGLRSVFDRQVCDFTSIHFSQAVLV